MKKSYFVHIGWAIVALASFLIGSQFVEKSETSTTAGPDGRSIDSQGLSSRSVERGNDGSASQGGRSGRAGGSSDSAVPTVLSEAQIKALGENLRTAKGPIAKRIAFGKILENLTPENAKMMREQILSLDNNSAEFREFHYAWGSMAGEEAVLNGGETPERDMASTLAGWASANPDQALAYFNNLSEEEKKKNDLKWGAAYGLADSDPNLAAQFAMDRLASGDNEARRMIDIATRAVMNNGDITEAAQWSASLPAGELQDEAVQRVAREFADKNPEEAYAWASTLPDGNGKTEAIGRSFSEWAGDDAQAAATEINSMGNSPERDAATRGYANRVAWEDPAAGLQWANTISDDKTRERTIIDTGRIFFRKDPEAAKQWLANSGLDEKQQAEVTRRRGRG